MRVGVVADTHVGEHLDGLPPEVCEVFAGVDLILHAGDVNVPSVLDELGRVAPVVAVRGNHDRALRHLPRDLLVRIGGRRIGLTHGSRPAAVEVPAAALSLVAGRPVLLGFARSMRGRFGDVDCVVTGHLHLPAHRVVGGALHFSPGAVYVPELSHRYDDRGLLAAGFRRFREGLPPSARRPSVGIIEIGRRGLRASVVPLERPVRMLPGRGSRPPRAPRAAPGGDG